MKLIVPIIFVIFLLGCGSGKKNDQKFESSKWKSDEYSRYLMVNDIIENDLLLKKTKKEVIELLGNPTERGPCDNCIGYSTYAPEQGFSIDHEVLEINFNDQNQVDDVWINLW